MKRDWSLDSWPNGSWSASRELAFYPNVKFEGIAFRYNAKTGKVVLSAHYEDQSGYVAAKIYLKAIPSNFTFG